MQMKTFKLLFGIFFAFALIGCSSVEVQSSQVPLVVQTPTEVKSAPLPSIIMFSKLNDDFVNALPNLWTKIDKEKISIYPFNWVSDFAYEKDGTLWIVGGFGVLRNKMDGSQTWYSIKNGLPNNFFTKVAISPKGEVWIGGTNNALFRFDGTNWIDEGVKLPLPFDDRTHYLCYSKTIRGIDFDSNGAIWVMNSGIEIYTQAHGEWLNFPFPKELLPFAGGGACPIGLRANTDKNITIKLSPC
jgi:ligand-binding sensor domain-containing protein